MTNHQHIKSIVLCTVLIFLTGCVAGPLKDARKEFYNNNLLKAATTLSEDKKIFSRDKLLLFMEKGLILHHLGKYQESTAQLLNASQLIKRQEVVSISQQTASLVTTEWITEYKGEYCERLWVHTYLMMNYLLMYKYEDALVEAKQALSILNKYPKALERDYFTRALIALCYENLHENNDAYIEYKKLAELMHTPKPVISSLYRLGSQLGFTKDIEYYKKFISNENLYQPGTPPPAELIVFVGVGKGPVKVPGNIVIPPSIRFSFPQYESRSRGDATVAVSDSGQRLYATPVTTNINAIANASLQDRAAKIMAKETARAATKETIARSVERKNDQIIGVLLRAAFFLMEEPDTRSWETLPAFLKLLRFQLKPGKHNLKIIVSGGMEEIVLPDITVSPGQRIYHAIRIND